MGSRPNWLANATQKVNADVAAGRYKSRVTADSFFHWRAYCQSTGHFMPITEVRISHKRAPRVEHITLTPAGIYMDARGW